MLPRSGRARPAACDPRTRPHDGLDEDGNHLSTGELRDVPRVAIAPAASAIRVLERIVPAGELLFGSQFHQFGGFG
ncbi:MULTISPECIES: hypothetical protein [Streptomyces]|uniref:hypothetical protein n=1 Tax=Streptomyces TaxID=1883 RepID=UPI00342D88E3